jgi:hypothetical protein
MQPEAVNLEKAGRASGRAVQDNSFHNCMARKIDMQHATRPVWHATSASTIVTTIATTKSLGRNKECRIPFHVNLPAASPLRG